MEKAIEDAIDWDQVLTRNGETQKTERYYISVIIEQLKKLGAVVGSNAAAQQAIDIRDVKWPDGSIESYEGKKVNTGCRFLFNDTFIKPDVWYIFIYGHLKKVRVVKGSDVIQGSTSIVDALKPKAQLKRVAKMVLTMLETELTPGLVKDLFLEVLEFLKSCVVHGVISYFDFGEMFKKSIIFGNFTSRPRPNWALKFPYKPSQSKEEEPRSPTA